MLRTVCVTLACVLVFVEAAVENTPDGCSPLRDCVTSFDKYFQSRTNAGEIEYSLFNDQTIGPFCESVQAASECVQDSRSECKSADYINSVVAFEARALGLCSDTGIAETLAMAKSDCIKNQESFKKYSSDVTTCFREIADVKIRSLYSEACEYYDSFARCIIDAGLGKCGLDYIKKELQRDSTPMRQRYGCGPLVFPTDLSEESLKGLTELSGPVYIGKRDPSIPISKDIIFAG